MAGLNRLSLTVVANVPSTSSDPEWDQRCGSGEMVSGILRDNAIYHINWYCTTRARDFPQEADQRFSRSLVVDEEHPK